jgi:hypothetical protein
MGNKKARLTFTDSAGLSNCSYLICLAPYNSARVLLSKRPEKMKHRRRSVNVAKIIPQAGSFCQLKHALGFRNNSGDE